MSKKKGNGTSYISFFIIMFILCTFMYSKGEKTPRKDIAPYNFPSINYDGLDDNTLEIISDKLNVEVNSDNKDEISLFNAIYNNKNLSDTEKNTFYGYYSVVNDIVNLDKNRAYDSFSRVSVNHVERDDKVAPNILGDYEYATGKINIYTADKDNSILLHEGVHCLFGSQSNISLPRAFQEGMTELITNEYYSDDPFYENYTYPLEVSYVKMLCELVGTEKVLDAYVSGDYSLIYREMDKYNNGKEISNYKILDIYEDAFNNIDHLGNARYSNDDRAKAYNLIEEIYNKKEDKSNSKEFKYLHELSASGFEENATEFFSSYIFYYGILEKAYISNKLKADFPNPNTVKFSERHFVLVNTKK